MGLKELQLRLTPGLFSTKIPHTQVDNTLLHSVPSVLWSCERGPKRPKPQNGMEEKPAGDNPFKRFSKSRSKRKARSAEQIFPNILH